MAKPQLVQYGGYQEAACCKYQPPMLPDGTVPPKVDAIRVFLQVSYRANAGAPLELVRMQPRGVAERLDWKLTDKEKAQSETRSVTHRFDVCIPCEEMKDRTARFEIIGIDSKLRVSRDRIGLVVGVAQFQKCCGKVVKPPVVPKRRS